jgi:ATP-binding cassette, subfamily C (CFTR/MRP), member 1
MFGPFIAAMLPRLTLIFFSFMQPLLISSITTLVSSPDSPTANSRGWSLAAAFGLVYVGLAIAGGAYQHKTNRMVTMIRGALVNAVYRQTLEVAVAGLEESKAVTLMSSDVERIVGQVLWKLASLYGCYRERLVWRFWARYLLPSWQYLAPL